MKHMTVKISILAFIAVDFACGVALANFAPDHVSEWVLRVAQTSVCEDIAQGEASTHTEFLAAIMQSRQLDQADTTAGICG